MDIGSEEWHSEPGVRPSVLDGVRKAGKAAFHAAHGRHRSRSKSQCSKFWNECVSFPLIRAIACEGFPGDVPAMPSCSGPRKTPGIIFLT